MRRLITRTARAGGYTCVPSVCFTAPTSRSVARERTSTVCEYRKTVACIASSSVAVKVFPRAAASRMASRRASPAAAPASTRVRPRASGDGAEGEVGAAVAVGGRRAARVGQAGRLLPRAPRGTSAARRGRAQARGGTAEERERRGRSSSAGYRRPPREVARPQRLRERRPSRRAADRPRARGAGRPTTSRARGRRRPPRASSPRSSTARAGAAPSRAAS